MTKRLLVIGIALIMSLGLLCGCEGAPEIVIPDFEELCITSEDGYVYYIDSKIGLCIIEIPDSEELELPEYIDGQPVMQLGYVDHRKKFTGDFYKVQNASKLKKITVKHSPILMYNCIAFNELEVLVYSDILYIYSDFDKDTLEIRTNFGSVATPIFVPLKTKVELRKGDKQVDLEDCKITTIIIPEFVTIIDSGVFDGLKGVTIKTSYESKPDGWEDGWNGECEVEWGAVIR